MADRDLKVPDFIRLFQGHGCSAELAKNNFAKFGGEPVISSCFSHSIPTRE